MNGIFFFLANEMNGNYNLTLEMIDVPMDPILYRCPQLFVVVFDTCSTEPKPCNSWALKSLSLLPVNHCQYTSMDTNTEIKVVFGLNVFYFYLKNKKYN